MPQFVDDEGNVWEATGPNDPNPVFVSGPQGGPQPVVMGQRDPTADYRVPKARADTRRAQAEANVTEATAPAIIRKTNAEAAAKEAQTGETLRGLRQWEDTQERKAMREAFQTDNMLRSIRNARRIAQEDGGTGWSSLLSGVPTTSAKRLESELSPLLGNLAFDRLQQMREESPTGGAVGNVSDNELKLLASTVASLDTAVDLPTFLERLDAIERHFIGMQLTGLGLDPNSEEGRAALKNEYGYTGVFDDEIGKDNLGLGDPNATQTRESLPEDYQRAHLRYLRDNWGRVDPADYVRFRTALDEAFGERPDLNAYREAVHGYNALAAEGGVPEQLGVVPAATREMGALEQGLNYSAQSAPGAAFANATNAFAAGLPARLGGGQDQLELLRESRPYSSAFGELVGAGAGALVPGAGAARLGGPIMKTLGNPIASEAAHGAVYGATQDEDPLRGAAYGAGGAVLGSTLGRQVGRAFPEVFAGKAIREADETVPTVQRLKEEAAGLYADVEAQGVTAGPEATTEMMERANKILASQGRIGGDGRVIIPDGPTKQAYDQLQSFAGRTMTPTQAQTVRETLGEGLTSNVPKERRIASQLLGDFDEWSTPVMPGADKAREVSSRYIRGQQLEGLTDRAIGRGRRLRGSDDAAQVRTLYGQLDEKVGQGQAFFDPATADQISKVAQGDGTTNALRYLGKFSPENVMPALGQSGGAVASVATGNPIPAMAAGGLAATGLFGRRLSNNRTLRAAKEAELTALGGQEYQDLLEAARRRAEIMSGRAFGGAAGAGGSMRGRPEPKF